MRFYTLVALAGALAVAGCGGRPALTSTPHLTVTSGSTLPPPDGMGAGATGRSFRIGAFDKLSVDVFGVEQLSVEEIQVDASGRISLPLVGSIEAAGRSPAELSGAIEERLNAQHVRNPRVAVNLTEIVSQVFTIDGEVERPGSYPAVANMTLMRAVAAAEGTSEFARLDDVVVFRTVGDQRMAALYNLAAIRRGQYADPDIFRDDIIVVGDSPARRLFRDVVSVSPLLAAPIIAVVQNR